MACMNTQAVERNTGGFTSPGSTQNRTCGTCGRAITGQSGCAAANAQCAREQARGNCWRACCRRAACTRRARAATGRRCEQAVAAAELAAATRACGCGTTCPAVADDLYRGAAARDAVCATCCDPGCPCRTYPVRNRNPFWPAFAHPRWLCCDQLYNARGTGKAASCSR